MEIGTFADDIRSAFYIHRSDIQITKFHPEDFFLTFVNHSDREEVLQEPRLVTRSGRVYHFNPWNERRNAEVVDIRYHARVCIEGIPMHARSEDMAAKLIGCKSSVHYIEEYSRRRNFNRTFDLWIWSLDLSTIPKATQFTITRPDREARATEIPFPDLEPSQPAPTDTKKGLTYPVIIHIDTVQDLFSRQGRVFMWHYGVPDDVTRMRSMAHPIQACRTLPAPERRSDDEDDHEQRSRRRHRSRSLWNRLGGRSSSKSREPGLDNRSSYNQETRGRQRERAADINRSRSRHLSRSVKPGETRIRRQSATPPHLSDPAPADKVSSPCKPFSHSRDSSPENGHCSAVASPPLEPLSPDILPVSQEQGALLMLKRHLDPMLHEAMVGGSIYSPDTTLPRPASPVFVLSSAAEPQENLVDEAQHDVETFLAEVTTPIQQPLLSAPGTKLRRPCRNKVTTPIQRHSARLALKVRRSTKLELIAQEILAKQFGVLDDNKLLSDQIKKLYLQHYKKPLSPADMKTITTLVENGGCKGVRLRAKKAASMVPI